MREAARQRRYRLGVALGLIGSIAVTCPAVALAAPGARKLLT